MVFPAITAFVFSVDTCIKEYVDRRFARFCPKEIFGGRLILDKFYNDGAALGFSAKKPKIIKFTHTLTMAAVAVYYYFMLKVPGRTVGKTGMALLTGGGFSNLLDRYIKGHVVDYVRFPFGPKKLRRIIFNVSDFFVFMGALLMAVGELLES
jgi:signal peptidase II